MANEGTERVAETERVERTTETTEQEVSERDTSGSSTEPKTETGASRESGSQPTQER